jgi:CelD/BcsL family acetyltransferase involved in cellulose biosynthesis
MSFVTPWRSGLRDDDRFEVVTDAHSLEALRESWDDLSSRCSQHRFSQSFLWCRTSWEVVEGPRGYGLHCIVARNQDRVVLIWPFVVDRRSFPSVATPLGCTYSEYPDPLVEDGSEAYRRIEAAWRTLRRTCGCDLIKLRFVGDGSLLSRLLSGMGRTAKIVSRVVNHRVTRRGHENWISYFSGVPAKDRSEIGRRRRQLERSGAVTFTIVTGEECAAAIDWALANKIEQLARTNRSGGDWLSTQAYRNLLVRAASQSSPLGRVVVFVLKLDEKIIATLIGRVDKVRVEGLNTVYDAAYSGAGRMLLCDVLKWTFAHELDFDMRGGNEAYKRTWSNQKSKARSFDVANTTLYQLYRWSPAIRPYVRILGRKRMGLTTRG